MGAFNEILKWFSSKWTGYFRLLYLSEVLEVKKKLLALRVQEESLYQYWLV